MTFLFKTSVSLCLSLLLLASSLSSYAETAPPLHRDVLVFVPAYEASQLFDPTLDEDKNDDPVCVWGNYNVFLSSKRYFALRMPNQLMAKPLLEVGPVDVYRKFVATITETSDDNPKFQPFTQGSDFFIFNYDWRQEIASYSAPMLGKALRDYAQIHESQTGVPAGKTRFVIVTHSMGGLVVRTLLREQPEIASRISKLYLVGSANAGSVKSIGTLVHGPDSIHEFAHGFPGVLLNAIPSDVDQNVTKLVGITRPSLYELLPTGDPHWKELEANGHTERVTGPEMLQAETWEPYWPSAFLEKSLFLDGWLKDRQIEGRKSIRKADWEFCQDTSKSKLKSLLAETRRFRQILGRLSDTNRVMTSQGGVSRMRIIYSEGLKTPTGVVTQGTHDQSVAFYLFDPANSGDGTMEARRVLDDVPRSASNVIRLNAVPHGRLMIDPQFLNYLTKELSDSPVVETTP